MKTNSPTTAELRTWARSKGMDVGDRGRLSPEVLAAWHAAHGNNGGAAPTKVATNKPTAKKTAAKPAAAKKAAAKKAAAKKTTAKAPEVAAPKAPAVVMATKPAVVVQAETVPSETELVVALSAQVTSLTKRVEQLESAAKATPPQRRGLFRKS